MPYTKSYRRHRRTARKTRTMGGIRKGFRGSRYRRTAMTTGRVKRIIDAELKFRDLSVGPVSMVAPIGQMIQITSIGQGDTNQQRNGNWIKPTSFMGTLTVTGNAASAVVVTNYRIGVLCWKENEAVDPATIAKVMQDSVDPHQQFNIQNKGQFQILWNRTGTVVNNTDNSQFQKIHRFYVKPPMKVLYDGAVHKKYHLFVFALCDQLAAGDASFLGFAVRLRYTDS